MDDPSDPLKDFEPETDLPPHLAADRNPPAGEQLIEVQLIVAPEAAPSTADCPAIQSAQAPAATRARLVPAVIACVGTVAPYFRSIARNVATRGGQWATFASGVAAGVLIAVLTMRQATAPAEIATTTPRVNITGTPDAAATARAAPNDLQLPAVPASSAGPDRARTVSSVHRGGLVVSSRPRGARVFINNRFAGRTPLVVRSMPAGSRAVRLTLDGYDNWSRGIRIVANESTTVDAQLSRKQFAQQLRASPLLSR